MYCDSFLLLPITVCVGVYTPMVSPPFCVVSLRSVAPWTHSSGMKRLTLLFIFIHSFTVIENTDFPLFGQCQLGIVLFCLLLLYTCFKLCMQVNSKILIGRFVHKRDRYSGGECCY